MRTTKCRYCPNDVHEQSDENQCAKCELEGAVYEQNIDLRDYLKAAFTGVECEQRRAEYLASSALVSKWQALWFAEIGEVAA